MVSIRASSPTAPFVIHGQPEPHPACWALSKTSHPVSGGACDCGPVSRRGRTWWRDAEPSPDARPASAGKVAQFEATGHGGTSLTLEAYAARPQVLRASLKLCDTDYCAGLVAGVIEVRG